MIYYSMHPYSASELRECVKNITFDIDPNKIGQVIAGVTCYSFYQLADIVKELNISIGIITVPPENAVEVAKCLVDAGIKGILNFTTIPLNVSSNVYLEQYDMITSIEKVAYFAKIT